MNALDHRIMAGAALVVAMIGSGVATAANNPPPAGVKIFSLDGKPIPHLYTNYSVDFVATNSTTNLSFAFREDPAFFSIDNIRLTNGVGPNLVVNGDFEQGPVGSHTPTGFSYLNLYNAPASGIVGSNCGTGGSACYYDGSVGSYDSITQAIATSVGSLYSLSFDLIDNSNQLFGSSVQNGDQAGINLVVYAGNLPTVTAAPEPAAWATMLLGFGMAGTALRRRRVRVSYAA